jgi:hypothetical protein
MAETLPPGFVLRDAGDVDAPAVRSVVFEVLGESGLFDHGVAGIKRKNRAGSVAGRLS